MEENLQLKELLNREKDFQSMIGNSRHSMETRKMIQKRFRKSNKSIWNN